jgi:hypothetical protein
MRPSFGSLSKRKAEACQYDNNRSPLEILKERVTDVFLLFRNGKLVGSGMAIGWEQNQSILFNGAGSA